MSTICDECGSSIRGGKKEVESHQKKFHKEIICEECGVQVKGWQAYHEHKRNCQKRHCDNCQKDISRKHFSAHVKKCNGAIGEFSCDQCDYKTDHNVDLKR